MNGLPVFATSYLPPVNYISQLVQFPVAYMEQWENFQKQTVRNRCYILSANGVQTLTVPVQRSVTLKIYSKDVKISYAEAWQRVHWAGLYSAYNKSPFFEHFRDEVEKIIFSNKAFLLDLNTELLAWILKTLKKNTVIKLTDCFEKNYKENDFRNLFEIKNTCIPDPTTPSKYEEQKTKYEIRPYPQVFSDKFNFVPNLGIVDLIFNTGNAASNYL